MYSRCLVMTCFALVSSSFLWGQAQPILSSPSLANPPMETAMYRADAGRAVRSISTGRFSQRLGARFTSEYVTVGGLSFSAVRLTSSPLPNSPLNQLGLIVGDVITRLDGMRVTSVEDMEQHVLETSVRFVRTTLNPGAYETGMIFIQPNKYFLEPEFDRLQETTGQVIIGSISAGP